VYLGNPNAKTEEQTHDGEDSNLSGAVNHIGTTEKIDITQTADMDTHPGSTMTNAENATQTGKS
jgi:hypothetical protein